jgi:hypothetical protein
LEKSRSAYLMKRVRLLSPSSSSRITQIIFDQASRAEFPAQIRERLSKDLKNIIIIPSNHEPFVVEIVNPLPIRFSGYNIELIGLSQWSSFQSVDLESIHRLNLGYFSPYYFSYDSADVSHFLSRSRSLFGGEPLTETRKGGLISFLGHDITWHFIKSFELHREQFILHAEEFSPDLLMNSFKFRKKSFAGGFENRSLIMVRYTPELSVVAEPHQDIPSWGNYEILMENE